MTTVRRSSAPLVTGIGTLITIALALPLLAPSCSDFQPGVKAFSKGSLIIPMDVCYQYQTDGVRNSYVPSSACPNGTVEAGDVIKAYGLVYQLIRNGVAVYWIIDPAKSSLTGVDLSIQFNAGFPVFKYDWSGAAPSVPPNTGNHVIKYLGGPFVIDGSDAVTAGKIFQKYKATFRPTATTGVNVHSANVAFTANVAKMLAGGWSAGGTVPPKLALLNIGSSGAGAKNSEVVIRGYLQKAGLDIAEPDPSNPAVMLQAGGDANGTHGTIYDRLVMDDFIPTVAGNQLSSRLFTNGYQILWVPHWAAPTSCSDCPPGTTCSCNVKYSANVIQAALVNIGTFGAGIPGDPRNPGRDIFAECAGLGSFEGVLNNGTYGTAVAGTHFQTVIPSPLVGAMAINTSTTTTPIYQGNNYASPLMQLGDYPFIPATGAIQNYKPASSSTAYVNVVGNSDNTIRLISETNGGGSYDIFTHRPGLTTGHGTFVYLGGHSYSGTDGSFEVGGTRLVLNTLFNLGASCTESGVACDTGLLGACGRGVFTCDATGHTVCTQVNFPKAEACNGIDDNCDGSVDEGLDRSCYDGPAGTSGVGICHAGVSSCVQLAGGGYGFSACVGQQLPQPEACNGLDDDCNGQVDDFNGTGAGTLTQGCYDGDASSLDPQTGQPRGACKAGLQTCTAGSWGACAVCPAGAPAASCQILPKPDDCSCVECSGGGKDWNCDGVIAACGQCTPTTTRSCYSGPSGTAGVGSCKAGLQTCDASGNWGTCVGEVLPQTEICNNAVDEDCNGIAESFPANAQCGECLNGTTQACYTGPAGTAGVGACKGGTRLCSNQTWGPCGSGSPQTLPSSEICDGLDNDCNGSADNGAQCGSGFACVNGVCVYDSCSSEVLCAEGYQCIGGHCAAASCGTGGPCPAGSTCRNGTCVDPNAGLNCGPGSSPAGGFCTGGACYETGCATGQLCLGGACTADPCAGLICPGGTFCRQGDCVQACAFISCGAGQSCGQDGFCVADACSGKSCGPTQYCVNGACVADPCSGVGCGAGQVCQGGNCVDDLCAGVACPAGQCQGGQCFAVGNPGGGVPPEASSSGCGCATGGAGTPLALLALLALAPLARRRRARPSGATLALLLGLGTLGVAGCTSTTPWDPASCTADGLQLAVCTGESRCIDLYTDPSHCGSCDRSCGTGQSCVDQVCGPATTVAPQITGVSPGTAWRGASDPVTVTLTGARFVAGATVRASYLGTTSTYAANVIDAGRLTTRIDLSNAAAATWQLRVVNLDRVISNQKPLFVQVPQPSLTRATPATAEIGTTVTVHLDGTGLMIDSICWLGGGTIPDTVLLSTLTGTGLDCLADLSGVPPAGYKIWVTNPTSGGTPLASNKLDFLATSSSAPTLTSLAPSAGKVNTIAAVGLFGGGFDVTSRAYFVYSYTSGGTAYSGETVQATSFVSANELKVAALDLTLCPPGYAAACPPTSASAPTATYWFKVKNGAASTASLEYHVDANPPAATSIAPASGYQGESVTVTASGSTLSGSVLQYQPPGGAFADATATSSTATTSTGTISLAGSATGTGQVRVRFPSGAYSASFPFAVLSNTAVLQSISPSSARQGTNPATVTLTVANLRPPAAGVRVDFSAAGNALVPSAVTATTVTVNLDLRGLDTGTDTLAVVNPNGAAPSNALNFTVTPGPPTLAAIACVPGGPGVCSSTTSAAQQLNRIPVTITGTNFAKPDASGGNGSIIYIFANCTPTFVVNPGPPAISQLTGCTCDAGSGVTCIPPRAVDATWSTVTVKSPTEIDALFDTTAAIPTTYSFWVQNPGGSPAPQRSNQLVDAFTITP